MKALLPLRMTERQKYMEKTSSMHQGFLSLKMSSFLMDLKQTLSTSIKFVMISIWLSLLIKNVLCVTTSKVLWLRELD